MDFPEGIFSSTAEWRNETKVWGQTWIGLLRHRCQFPPFKPAVGRSQHTPGDFHVPRTTVCHSREMYRRQQNEWRESGVLLTLPVYGLLRFTFDSILTHTFVRHPCVTRRFDPTKHISYSTCHRGGMKSWVIHAALQRHGKPGASEAASMLAPSSLPFNADCRRRYMYIAEHIHPGLVEPVYQTRPGFDGSHTDTFRQPCFNRKRQESGNLDAWS